MFAASVGDGPFSGELLGLAVGRPRWSPGEFHQFYLIRRGSIPKEGKKTRKNGYLGKTGDLDICMMRCMPADSWIGSAHRSRRHSKRAGPRRASGRRNRNAKIGPRSRRRAPWALLWRWVEGVGPSDFNTKIGQFAGCPRQCFSKDGFGYVL